MGVGSQKIFRYFCINLIQRRKYIKSMACGSVCFALCGNGEQWSIYKENPLRPSFVQRWVLAASWRHWSRTKHWRISRNCCDVDKWDPLYTQFILFLTLLMVKTPGVKKEGGEVFPSFWILIQYSYLFPGVCEPQGQGQGELGFNGVNCGLCLKVFSYFSSGHWWWLAGSYPYSKSSYWPVTPSPTWNCLIPPSRTLCWCEDAALSSPSLHFHHFVILLPKRSPYHSKDSCRF